MPDIPATHRYYPSVPLYELSDVYSKGNQRLGSNRAVVLSFLPKTLRVGRELPYTNRYVLFIEGTTTVTRIEWKLDLFLNGERIANPGFVEVASPADGTEFFLRFQDDVTGFNGQPLCDRVRVTCDVENDGRRVELTVEHNVVAMLSATGMASADVVNRMTVPFSGDPVTTNYLLNLLKDYLQPGVMTWNNTVIDLGVPDSDPLLRIVAGILYHNILVSPPDSSTPVLQEVSSVGMRAFFNDGAPYEGDFVNGICRIPLHILSDVLTGQLQVPDFTAIGSGTGNPVYNIIRDQGLLTYNNLEGDILRTVPQKIQDSKQRLLNNPSRFLELYHLTSFPKSAIRLAALVVKYLHECSILNQCNECKGRSPLWPFVTLEGLKDHPEFLKNILTHYYREPSNKIESFAREAAKSASFPWSPAVHTILNVAPRIVRAYFATKVATQVDGGHYVFDFRKIDSSAVRLDADGARLATQPAEDSMLGRQVYLVAETLHSRNQQLVLNILPSDGTLTGDTGPLALASGRELSTFSVDLARTVGNYDDLRNNTNDEFTALTREFLDVDHKDKVIAKLRLRPNTAAAYTTWTTNLGDQTANLHIRARYADNRPAFFGNDRTATRAQDFFLSPQDKYQVAQFRVVNRIVYEIYHTDNRWNRLTVPTGAPRRIIGRIHNDRVDTVTYLYYDDYDTEHEICTTTRFLIDEKGARQGAPTDAVPTVPAVGARGALVRTVDLNPFRNAGENIDATTLDLHQNGTLGHGNVGDRWYPDTGNQVYLVDADILHEAGIPGTVSQNFRAVDYRASRVRVTYFFQDTRRRYCNPDVFAGIIGALAKLYLTPNPNPNPNNINYQAVEVISEGSAYEDGSCYPSTGHRNGLAFDTHWLDPPPAGANRHRDVQQAFVNAMSVYYFQRNIVGSNTSGHTGYANSVADNGQFGGIHNNHMHSERFNHGAVDAIIQ